jgi:chromosome partitioning protein
MRTPLIFAVMCHKGGTGKTTTVAGLADALSKAGKKILIVDADEQSNIKTIFGIKLQNSEGGLAAILLDNVNPQNMTCKVRENIDVILSGGRFMRDFEKTHANTPDSELLLKLRMHDVGGYDVVLVDTPPALSLISTNIVTFADYLLLPCSPDLLSVVGVKNTLNFVENIESHYKAKKVKIAKVLGVIPTMHDGRRNLDMDILDDLHRLENADLLRGGRVFTPIRIDIKVKTAQVKRKLLSETFPDAKATQDYTAVAQQIMDVVGLNKSNNQALVRAPDLAL